jgi:hypothetical protein
MVYSDAELARILAGCRTAKGARQSSDDVIKQRTRSPESCDAAENSRLGPLMPSRRNGSRRNGKNGTWRDDARILEELYPEMFAEPKARESSDIGTPDRERSQSRSGAVTASSESVSPTSSTSVAEPQSLANAPESVQSASAVPSAPSPIPPLPSAFWQGVLYGNPDDLLPGADATNALRLVADKLGVAIAPNETIATLRAGALRKLLRERFGPSEAEQTMAALWRSAPSTPGAPQPADSSTKQLPIAPARAPAWVEELNQPSDSGPSCDWLIDNGLWCG